MALTRKRKILLGVATGCLSYLSLGSAATYTTGTEVPTGTELVLTAGDTVNINVPSGENQVPGFSASGAGASLVINGTQMVGSGGNLLSVINARLRGIFSNYDRYEYYTTRCGVLGDYSGSW